MKTLRAMVHWVALAIGLGIGAPASWAATTTNTAIVMAVRGTGTLDGKEVKVATAILPGATLSTGSESTVDLNLKLNGPFLRLLQDSRLSILELTLNQDGAESEIVTRLRLEAGSISGFVRHTSELSRYSIETPAGAVTVREGCKFKLSVGGDLRVAWGCASIRYHDSDYTVCAGQEFDPRTSGVIDSVIVDIIVCPGLPEAQPGPEPVGPVIHISPVK